MSKLDKIVPLRQQAGGLYEGKIVTFADPDLRDHPRGPIMTQGKVIGFDEEKEDVLVVLDGEPNAARRFKPLELV